MNGRIARPNMGPSAHWTRFESYVSNVLCGRTSRTPRTYGVHGRAISRAERSVSALGLDIGRERTGESTSPVLATEFRQPASGWCYRRSLLRARMADTFPAPS